MNAKKVSVTLLGLIFKLTITIVVVLVVYNIATAAYDFGYRIFSEEPMSEAPGTTVTVSITQGKSVLEIGSILVESGLIRDEKLFYVQAFLYEKKDAFLPGEYQLNTSMTVEEIMEILSTEPEEETSETGDESDSAMDTTGGETSTDTQTEEDNTGTDVETTDETTDETTVDEGN